MDELIGRLAAKAGIDSAVAEKTIGIVLGFLRNEGPSDKVQALIDQIPGAEAAIVASSSNSGLSRLMGRGLIAQIELPGRRRKDACIAIPAQALKERLADHAAAAGDEYARRFFQVDPAL